MLRAPAAAPGPTAPVAIPGQDRRAPGSPESKGTGWVVAARAAAVLIVGALGSALLWRFLGAPARWLTALAPSPSYCAQYEIGTLEMYLCSARVAVLAVLGPVLLVVAGLLLRRPIGRLGRLAGGRVPPAARFLVAPLLATTLFAMAWSGLQPNTLAAMSWTNRAFPGVVGAVSYLMIALRPVLTSRFGGVLRARDRIPAPLRVAVALVIPIWYAFQATNADVVYDTTGTQQAVVLLSLVTAFLALVPRAAGTGASPAPVAPVR